MPLDHDTTPPRALLYNASLFLDFDGTLVDLVDHPDGVIVDRALHDLLCLLAHRHPGRVALVSGRSLEQLDALLGPLAAMLALSGSHGSEYRFDDIGDRPSRPRSLDWIEARLRACAATQPGVIVEAKTLGVALHYRQAPEFGPRAQAIVSMLASQARLVVQHGKMMVEARLPGADKGGAVARLMQRVAMAGTRPIFIGDDLTDEPGFATAGQLGGAGILVGKARPTAAAYRLADPAAVRQWLAGDGP